MIPLQLQAQTDAQAPYVTRLRYSRTQAENDSWCLATTEHQSLWCGEHGLVQIEQPAAKLEGDVVLVSPGAGKVERLLRAGSRHNTLLVTERCDQLCIMCSQPPKKTHEDRFDLLTQACLLAEPGTTIGITGGEPTLFKDQLLELIELVLVRWDDLSFHVLSNGQHFTQSDIQRLRDPLYRRVVWGIPIYSANPSTHDRIVAKPGAYERLHEQSSLLERPGELEAILQDHGGALQVASICRTFAVHPDLERDEGIATAKLLEAIDMAALLGSSTIYLVTGGRESLSWERAAARFAELLAGC